MNKERIFERITELARGYGLNRLSVDSGISRQGVYRLLNEKNPQFDTLNKITSTLHIDLGLTENIPSTNEIYSSLRFHGAPISTELSTTALSLEETIARGILLSRKDGFISSIIPYILYKKSDEINSAHLIGLCDNLGEIRALGYYADLANAFKPDNKLKLIAEILFRSNFTKEDFFNDNKTQTTSYKKLASMIDNPIAKKWKFQTIDGLSEQIERFKKWRKQE